MAAEIFYVFVEIFESFGQNQKSGFYAVNAVFVDADKAFAHSKIIAYAQADNEQAEKHENAAAHYAENQIIFGKIFKNPVRTV